VEKMRKQESRVEENSSRRRNLEKTESELTLVEAALYVTGRPLDLNDLCSVLRTRSKNKTRELAKKLMKKYAERNTALEILELKDERYVLQLKTRFTPRVKRLVKKPLLTAGPLRTLAYIAYRQPVSQKRVAEIRGGHAYSHIRQLKEMELVVGEKRGRSTTLRTTGYFADYFGLASELSTMKRELKKYFQKEITFRNK